MNKPSRQKINKATVILKDFYLKDLKKNKK